MIILTEHLVDSNTVKWKGYIFSYWLLSTRKYLKTVNFFKRETRFMLCSYIMLCSYFLSMH